MLNSALTSVLVDKKDVKVLIGFRLHTFKIVKTIFVVKNGRSIFSLMLAKLS